MRAPPPQIYNNIIESTTSIQESKTKISSSKLVRLHTNPFLRPILLVVACPPCMGYLQLSVHISHNSVSKAMTAAPGHAKPIDLKIHSTRRRLKTLELLNAILLPYFKIFARKRSGQIPSIGIAQRQLLSTLQETINQSLSGIRAHSELLLLGFRAFFSEHRRKMHDCGGSPNRTKNKKEFEMARSCDLEEEVLWRLDWKVLKSKGRERYED